ncbi:tryptophan halogenase family protein [Parasphingorhabdus cellanae]|uniref:Tryptophan 7-halogenase n=1 Tax=Parasphingorhabdus cellanae TaxID=2806553 RepID=A0ABX7T125_9SPHN|nr:tryptophan halogenase family protein [Parasphingorhabdus cellanae]QTD55249.1 tryptophan 7-halogenase [Parasphingorhabdus cellanae]
MAAAALSRFLGKQANITLIESDAIGTVGVGEATIPQIRLFNHGLGIDENAFVAATQGSFKLGIQFDGWNGDDQHYIHAFGNIGRQLGLVGYHHYWLRALKGSQNNDLWSASPCAVAANENRFARVEERPGQLPSGVAYAYHFDAGLYAKFLRQYAETNGVKRIEGTIAEVAQHPESGVIQSLHLESGQAIAGDFFIDCSGFRGLLIEGALNAGYDDWRHWLPCDRAVAVPCEASQPLTPYTKASARKAGWQWRIPLQHRTGNGHVYSSAHISDDEAASILLDNLDGAALDDPRQLQFTTGKRKRAWVKNCVALGLSAGFMEPLESTSIHLIQSAIARLLQLLPGAHIAEADIAEYNCQTDFEWERIRDFLILHYHANGRNEPFWQAVRDAEIPDSLAHKIALFEANGRIVREHEELFTEAGWLQVLIGQGIMPDGYHPLADQLSEKDLSEFLKLAGQHATAVASRMPDHGDYIAQHCAAAQISSPTNRILA